MAADAGSVAVKRLDLDAGSPDLPPRDDGRDTHLTAWCAGVPLGTHEFNARGMGGRALADSLAHLVAGPVGQRLLGEGFEGWDSHVGIPPPDTVPALGELLALDRPVRDFAAAVSRDAPRELAVRVTLAICTRERPDSLERCLASLAAADPAADEVIVVDNAPSPATRAVVERFPGVRYLAEPRPGLSAARNAAAREARGDVLAFVDDDTEVTPGWLARLCAPFAEPEVAATTGLVLPAALDTPSQLRFEKLLGGLTRGYQAMTYGREFFARTRPYATPVWRIGAGANMAVRLDLLRRLGGFDERLGAGTSGCSEDSELWYRLLAEDWTCRYEPASVVLHHHRADETSLEHQAHEYVRGHVAALFVQYARYGHVGNLRRAFVQIPRWLGHQALLDAIRRALAFVRMRPRELRRPARSELVGYARGLGFLPLARRSAGGVVGKAPLRAFLAANPFPEPYTEGFFYREKLRAIHRVAPDAVPARVLEISGGQSGQSGLARRLYPSAHITVLDADATYARSAVDLDPMVTFVHGDATRLPFADATFDVVTLLDVLEHIEDERTAAAEALRVARPGGSVVASSRNERWRSPYHTVMRPLCPSDEEVIERWGHVRRGYTVEGFARLFGTAPTVRADFLNPVTVVAHDVAFSRLPARARRALLVALTPLTWAGYWLQPRGARGMETAVRWRRPAG